MVRLSAIGVVAAERLGAGGQVIATAEAWSVASEGDHMHIGMEIRPLHATGKFSGHVKGDRIAVLRPIQVDAGDWHVDAERQGAAGGFIGPSGRAHADHPSATISSRCTWPA